MLLGIPKDFSNVLQHIYPEIIEGPISLLATRITQAVHEIYGNDIPEEIVIHLEHPSSENYGDYSTNIALVLAKPLKRSPQQIAHAIKEKIEEYIQKDRSTTQQTHKKYSKEEEIPIADILEKVAVDGPGFLNLSLKTPYLITQTHRLLISKNIVRTTQSKNPPTVMVEFGDPNTHKAFHIGHLRNITIGESLARLLTAIGCSVVRANYQGDVGMHIAKCLYGLIQNPDLYKRALQVQDIKEKVHLMGQAYTFGSSAYEEKEGAKKEIGEINKSIYTKDASIFSLYKETRQWSLDYFETIYKRVGTTYDRYYFESEVFEAGKEHVQKGLEKGIFEKSEGAVIFPGEKFGLHNRVFITQEGNPTYEGKDMGLGILQYTESHAGRIIRVVGPEQAGYFQVVFEAQAQLFTELRDKFHHLVAGWVRLKHGKMSSRLGNVVLGDWLLDEAKKKIETIGSTETSEIIAVAAVKYSLLKVHPRMDIAFDLEESISLEGDSGPYLLYTYVRCKSVLRKTTNNKQQITEKNGEYNLNEEEKALLRVLYRFPEVVVDAAVHFSPNLLCSFLYDCAKRYNTFYHKHQIIQTTKNREQSTNFRLFLTETTASVLQRGLDLLGVKTVEKM